ncbi:Crp/Fnr family transcriptional regulator [Phenylobacterium sp.]|uniref:Crp/Fnr family transcriptional regulator n=1 Tax=Phenylobacterium sp. TaxID=1871053 RepID=UPI0035B1E545
MGQLDYIASRSAAPAGASCVAPADSDDVQRVRAFWRRVERYPAGVQMGVESGPGRGRRLVIVSGWACELRILPDGRRQIFGFLLPGDVVDTEVTRDLGARGVMTLTRLQAVEAEGEAADPATPAERAAAASRREERLYDHMVRMGRLTARERVLHLLLELCERLEAAGLVRDESFRIPLTQELFADTLGLSVVHINRTLKALREEGSITLKAGSVTLHNRARLAVACCYEPPRPVAGLGAGREGVRRRTAEI